MYEKVIKILQKLFVFSMPRQNLDSREKICIMSFVTKVTNVVLNYLCHRREDFVTAFGRNWRAI